MNRHMSARRQPHSEVELAMPLLVSVPEASRLLGIGKSFGWEMVRTGEMPTVRLGKRVLVARAALERLAGLLASDAETTE